MPDDGSVKDKVSTEISKASGVSKSALKDGHKLRQDLAISHENFVTLAQNLRSFIKHHNPVKTLVLKEIDTASATVVAVVTLVQERVGI